MTQTEKKLPENTYSTLVQSPTGEKLSYLTPKQSPTEEKKSLKNIHPTLVQSPNFPNDTHAGH